jgi:hypothetical protein
MTCLEDIRKLSDAVGTDENRSRSGVYLANRQRLHELIKTPACQQALKNLANIECIAEAADEFDAIARGDKSVSSGLCRRKQIIII